MAKNRGNERLVVRIIVLCLLLVAGLAMHQGWFEPAEESFERSSEFVMTVLELDSADCILLEHKDSVVLIDGGENRDAGTIIGFLKNRRISVIDLVIATHPHADHIGGLDDVLADEDFVIKKVIFPEVPEALAPDTSAVRNFYQAVRDCGAEVCGSDVGTVIDLGDILITVLAPVRDDYSELNDFSLVVRADCGDVSVLLTGDAEKPSELDMLEGDFADLLRCDILKVGHHGGKTSTCAAFAAAVRPQIALIPARADLDDYHLLEDARRRLSDVGAQVYDSCTGGRLTVYVNDEGRLVCDTAKAS